MMMHAAFPRARATTRAAPASGSASTSRAIYRPRHACGFATLIAIVAMSRTVSCASIQMTGAEDVGHRDDRASSTGLLDVHRRLDDGVFEVSTGSELYSATISSFDDDDSGSSREIHITKNLSLADCCYIQLEMEYLTIRSAGSGMVELDGGGVARMFYVGVSTTLDASDIVFRNAYAGVGMGQVGEGAAMRIAGSAIFNRCHFVGNYAAGSGGAVSVDGGYAMSAFAATATFYDCEFVGNSAQNSGGALYCAAGTTCRIFNSRVVASSSHLFGGALYGAFTAVENSIFLDNSVGSFILGNDGSGGTIFGSGSFINCTFGGGSAYDEGGFFRLKPRGRS